MGWDLITFGTTNFIDVGNKQCFIPRLVKGPKINHDNISLWIDLVVAQIAAVLQLLQHLKPDKSSVSYYIRPKVM